MNKMTRTTKVFIWLFVLLPLVLGYLSMTLSSQCDDSHDLVSMLFFPVLSALLLLFAYGVYHYRNSIRSLVIYILLSILFFVCYWGGIGWFSSCLDLREPSQAPPPPPPFIVSGQNLVGSTSTSSLMK